MGTSSQSAVDTHEWYPTPFGPTVSPVLRDMNSGQHITLVKFEPGMTSAVHTHSHDYVGVVVSENGWHFEPDRPDTQIDLPSGSHWFIPANVPLISTCVGPESCIFALFQNHPFDFNAAN